MASEDVLERLHHIAREEKSSLAEVIRQALEWRAAQPKRRFRFIGAGRSTEPPFDFARRSADMQFEPRSWR